MIENTFNSSINDAIEFSKTRDCKSLGEFVGAIMSYLRFDNLTMNLILMPTFDAVLVATIDRYLEQCYTDYFNKSQTKPDSN